jgi:hypothetical protein
LKAVGEAVIAAVLRCRNRMLCPSAAHQVGHGYFEPNTLAARSVTD